MNLTQSLIHNALHEPVCLCCYYFHYQPLMLTAANPRRGCSELSEVTPWDRWSHSLDYTLNNALFSEENFTMSEEDY